MKKFLLIGLIIMAVSAQESKTSVSAEVFMDYFYSINHAAKANNIDGFLFRRANVSAKHTFNETMSAVVKLESESGSFTTENSLAFNLKDAYFEYQLNDQSELVLGLQKNPVIKRFEKFYGHRYIEKTPSDLYKLASSRIMGLSYIHSISKEFTAQLSLANGEGNKSESNKGDLVAFDLNYNNKNIFADLSGQYNSSDKDTASQVSMSLALGTVFDQLKILVSGHFLEVEDKATKLKANTRVASFFASYDLDETSLFLRVDRMFTKLVKSPSYYNMKTGEEMTHFIAGFSSKLDKNISISPTIKLTNYDDFEDNDVIYACTLFFKW
jgi:hypothetical protein